jgi:hypothetical protein
MQEGAVMIRNFRMAQISHWIQHEIIFLSDDRGDNKAAAQQ